MKFVATALSCAAFVLLSACATQIPWDSEANSVRLGMDQGEVQTVLGPPNRTWTDENGLLVWGYERNQANGPDTRSGQLLSVTFMNGRASSVRVSNTTSTTTTSVSN